MAAHESVLMVHAEIAPELEQAFKDWYDGVHIPDVLSRADHWLTCRRYALAGAPPAHMDPAGRYLAIWELDTRDVVEARRCLVEALAEPRARGRLQMADAMTFRFSAHYIAIGEQPPAPADASPASTLIVYTDVPDTLEGDFNRWYDEVHIPDIVATTPLILSARRYKLDGAALGNQTPVGRYLTIYQVGTPDIEAVQAALHTGMEVPRSLGRTEMVQRTTFVDATGYVALGPVATRESVLASLA